MAQIGPVVKEVEVRETVILNVPFKYELVNGEFKNPDDEAHYNKYIEYLKEETEGE